MKRRFWQIPLIGAVAITLIGGTWMVASRSARTSGAGPAGVGDGPVPVEISPVRRGPIERRRILTGTLEAVAEFVVASKVAGRLKRVAVDLGDTVERGQVVAELDDDEYVQVVAEARATLAVERARHTARQSAATITKRSLERSQGLSERGLVSELDLDTARAEHLEAEAAVKVAAAEVLRAQATLRAAEVRAGYTRVTADWPGEDPSRVVGARFADEGEMVAANSRLLSIVDLDPINVVVHATEKGYGELAPGKPAKLTTDAYPGEVFSARVARVAPVFRVESRQARIELTADNPEGRLKPGMFVRAEVLLDRVDEATIVSQDALVVRDGKDAVFVVSGDRKTVALRPVTVGIRQDGFVQVKGDGIEGHVVTLGQQQLKDGSAITIPPSLVRRGDAAAPPVGSGTEGGS